MAIFAEGFFDFLSDGATNAASRIYPNALPQGVVLPAIRYFKVSDPPERTHSGPSKLAHPRYQLDCFADGDEAYKDAVTLAEQVITLIDGYVGPMGTFTVHAGFRDEMHDDFDPETGRYSVSVDAILWHERL
jgi:hypothetical protein